MRAPRLLSILLMAIVLGGCSKPPAPTDHLTEGEPLPAMTLTTLDGQQVDFSDYRGRLVVFNIWATWCEPCRREMPALQRLSDSLDPKRFAVVGVAAEDDVHVVREFLIDKGLKFARYIDADHSIANTIVGATLFPYTLLVAPDGTFLQRVPGPREWDKPEVRDLLERLYHENAPAS